MCFYKVRCDECGKEFLSALGEEDMCLLERELCGGCELRANDEDDDDKPIDHLKESK